MAIHHLQIWVPDIERAERSWGWLLGELGFELSRRLDQGRVWSKDRSAIVLETSPDMVPGMLYSRLRPGMNHIAFHADSGATLRQIVNEAGQHGWRSFDAEGRHQIPGQTLIAYLEDRDGFEVELIATEA